MARRKQKLYLGCDDGASSFKCIGSSGEELVTIVMPSATIEQRSETLEREARHQGGRYRQQTGDLSMRSFVGIDDDYYAVGKLATRLGATQPLKPLKSETIVYKILEAV